MDRLFSPRGKLIDGLIKKGYSPKEAAQKANEFGVYK
jgi:hypothetical protein